MAKEPKRAWDTAGKMLDYMLRRNDMNENKVAPATDEEIASYRSSDPWSVERVCEWVPQLIARIDAEKANARRLFEALETALKKGASWESRQEAADLLDELRPHVKESGE